MKLGQQNNAEWLLFVMYIIDAILSSLASHLTLCSLSRCTSLSHSLSLFSGNLLRILTQITHLSSCLPGIALLSCLGSIALLSILMRKPRFTDIHKKIIINETLFESSSPSQINQIIQECLTFIQALRCYLKILYFVHFIFVCVSAKVKVYSYCLCILCILSSHENFRSIIFFFKQACVKECIAECAITP